MKARWLLLLSVCCLLGADDKELAINKEKDKLIGTWDVAAYEINGRKDPELSQQLKVVITLKEFVVQQGEQENKSSYQLDPTKNPKAIDLNPASGTNMGRMLPGIYEFDGKTLRVIWNDKGKGRPKTFATQPDSGDIMLTLKRPPKD